MTTTLILSTTEQEAITALEFWMDGNGPRFSARIEERLHQIYRRWTYGKSEGMDNSYGPRIVPSPHDVNFIVRYIVDEDK